MNGSGEKALYENGGTYISSARAIIAGTTFAIAGISSVREVIETRRNYWPMLLLFSAGVFIGLYTGNNITMLVGAVLALAAGLVIKPLTTYKILTTTHGREFGMLTTTDREEARRIVNALNAAIISQAR